MKHLSLYRIATYLILLFCAGHTGGGMLAQKSGGASCTWYGFWFSFGLTASVSLLLAAVIAWQLDKVEPQAWPAVSVIAWALVASFACNTVLAGIYLFAGPTLLSTILTILLGAAAWRKGTTAVAARRVR